MKEGDNFLKNSQFGEFGKKKGINFFEKTAPFLFSHHLSKFDYFLNGLKKEIEEIFPIVFSAGTTESFLELSKIKKRIINFSDNFQFEKIDSRQELIILGVVRYVFRANLNGKVARAKQLADLSDADLFIPKTSFFPILNKEVEGKLLFLISKFLNHNLPKESPIFSKIK